MLKPQLLCAFCTNQGFIFLLIFIDLLRFGVPAGSQKRLV